jgi:TldD protein
MLKRLFVFVLLAATLPASAADLMQILGEEMDRNFKVLQARPENPAYFIAYAVTERQSAVISSTMGALASKTRDSSRVLDVTVRVGSHKLDNYHVVRGNSGQFTRSTTIALENTPEAIKRTVWTETDRVYRAAVQRLLQIQTNRDVTVSSIADTADFSIEQPEQFTGKTPPLTFDADAWTALTKRLSARFSQYPRILDSSVTLQVVREVKYFVNTEGARVLQGQPFSRVMISAEGKANDGMDLSTYDSFAAADFKDLPSEAEMMKSVDKVAKDLVGLLDAPVVDAYAGPAILSGSAAGVFFHEIFGHRVEGHRLKDENDGQTFAKRIGQPVLPDFLSVVFDPTLRRVAGRDLNGWYQYDDEGVKAQKVTVVNKGILETFLMSRAPIEGIDHSNGHGRRQSGSEVVSRQSNLIVEASKTVPEAQLKRMLIEEVKKREKPYGYYFQEITGGFTITTAGRNSIQAFKVIPLVVYRIYPDGREQLVRGVDIVGTPLASFNKIIAAGDKLDIFNGYCGAESGYVPVSAVSPSLLVSELEIARKESSRSLPPILPPPAINRGAR